MGKEGAQKKREWKQICEEKEKDNLYRKYILGKSVNFKRLGGRTTNEIITTFYEKI